METKQKISIRIAANPNANGGYRIIGGSDMIDNSFKENDYAGFSRNSYYFAFSIKEGWADYCLLQNNVFSHGASRKSPALKIYVSIPRGYALQDNVSPYNVLVDIRDIFLNRCMTKRGDGSYEYMEDINLDFLREVADRHSLVRYYGPYRPMRDSGKAWANDSAVACIVVPDETKIRELLADVQYPEFEGYGEIVVATAYDGSPYPVLRGISIPRPCEYKVYIDNKDKYVGTDSKTNESKNLLIDTSWMNKTGQLTIIYRKSKNMRGKEQDDKYSCNVKIESSAGKVLGERNFNKYKPNSSKKYLIIIALIAAAVLGGITGWYLHSSFGDSDASFICSKCSEQFEDQEELEKHEGKTHDKECELCGMVFTDADGLNAHMKEKHPVCSWCGEQFEDQKKLAEHEEIPHDFSCDLCYKAAFTDADGLKTHMKGVHHACILCGEQFEDQNKLAEHEDIPHNFRCDLCGMAFIDADGLKKHKEEKHPVCSKCGEQFEDQNKLAKHEDIPHNFRCDQCGMTFTDVDSLNAHKASRHPVFKCDECGEAFNNRNKLNTHIKSEHRTCKICGPNRWFDTNKGLENHMKTFHKKKKGEEWDR